MKKTNKEPQYKSNVEPLAQDLIASCSEVASDVQDQQVQMQKKEASTPETITPTFGNDQNDTENTPFQTPIKQSVNPRKVQLKQSRIKAVTEILGQPERIDFDQMSKDLSEIPVNPKSKRTFINAWGQLYKYYLQSMYKQIPKERTLVKTVLTEIETDTPLGGKDHLYSLFDGVIIPFIKSEAYFRSSLKESRLNIEEKQRLEHMVGLCNGMREAAKTILSMVDDTHKEALMSQLTSSKDKALIVQLSPENEEKYQRFHTAITKTMTVEKPGEEEEEVSSDTRTRVAKQINEAKERLSPEKATQGPKAQKRLFGPSSPSN